MTREEHDKAMDAITKELVTLGDDLVDQGYPFDLIWVSMLMFAFQTMVHLNGKSNAWKDVRQLADNYFGGLSAEEEALIRRGRNPANKTN